MEAIRIQAVTKYFQGVAALKDLTLSIEPGQLVGLLGINGAGKTTLMRILKGTLLADSGEITLGGYSLEHHPLPARRLIGYLGEIPALYDAMTLREYLHFVRGLKGLAFQSNALDNLAEELELTERLNHRLRTLSKGFRQRVGLAAALIGDPPILLLDEPSTGLDPKQANEFRKKILSLKGKQTILFSSHLLHEVEAISDEVRFLHQGRLLEPKHDKEWALIITVQTAELKELNDFAEHFLKHPVTANSSKSYTVAVPHTSATLTWQSDWQENCTYYEITPVRGQVETYTLSIYFDPDATIMEEGDAMARFLNLALMERKMLVSTLVKKRPSLEEQFLKNLLTEPSNHLAT